MRSTKSPNLELTWERKTEGSGYIILIFLDMSLFELYLIRIKDMINMIIIKRGQR